MTFLLHGTLAALTVAWLRRWWIAAVAFLQGITPDVAHLWDAPGVWTVYEWAHQYHWWLLPFGWLHVWVDRLWHTPDGGWYWWGIWAEIVIWLLILVETVKRYIEQQKGK